MNRERIETTAERINNDNIGEICGKRESRGRAEPENTWIEVIGKMRKRAVSMRGLLEINIGNYFGRFASAGV